MEGNERERGAAIVFLSVMMVLLLGLAAFAVDLGWLLVNGSRLQRAADSAALHGVTYLPGFISQAQTAAEQSASANGFPTPGTSVVTSQPEPGQLTVDLTTTVETFFLRVFGMDQVTISRDATAEYVKPVPMGGDSAVFGDGNNAYGTGQRFWASIQGQFTNRLHGDPYATQCGAWPDRPEVSPPGLDCGGTSNPEYRPAGYWLVVDVPEGHSGNVSVLVFDGGFNPGSCGSSARDCYLGDGSGSTGITTTFTQHTVDLTPYDPSDNPRYSSTGCRIVAPPGTNADEVTLCTLSNPVPGLYPIHITSSSGEGINSFRVRATSSSGAVRVYGINDISIWTTVTGLSTIPLADVEPIHAGKTLLLSFYDPGDASGQSGVAIRGPGGSPTSCVWWTSSTAGSSRPSSPNAASPCRIETTSSSGTRYFNGQWINMEIDIPTDYTCSSDCLWTVGYNLTGATDRTVWEARVIGNPVHLVIGTGSG